MKVLSRCYFVLALLVMVNGTMTVPGNLLRYFGVDSPENAPEFEIMYPEVTANTYGPQTVTRAGISFGQMTIDVSALGETFRMEVYQDDSFVADGLEVEYVGGPTGRQTVRTDCYYRGSLTGYADSLVSVSACSGIIAFIRREPETFYIEPLDEQDAETLELQDNHQGGVPHIMYKGGYRGDLRSSCDVIHDEKDNFSPGLMNLKHRLEDFEGLPQQYLETMVVGDSALYDIRGANTANSILALMNSVAHVLALPSLIGDKLQLVVVDMRIYTNNTSDLTTAEHGHWTLFHFCKWQNKNNPGRDDNPKHYDIATLLTGRDIYGNHGNGTKGISPIGTTCEREKQCSLVEFLDQDAIYATAHEIGHNLGMHHDGHHGNTCPEEGFLMCPHMQDNEEELGWSTCSRNYLLNFLNTTGTCLEDEPKTNLLPDTN